MNTYQVTIGSVIYTITAADYRLVGNVVEFFSPTNESIAVFNLNLPGSSVLNTGYLTVSAPSISGSAPVSPAVPVVPSVSVQPVVAAASAQVVPTAATETVAK